MKLTKEQIKEKSCEGKKAANLILECIKLNNVEPATSLDSLQLVYVSIVIESEISYEDYCKSLDAMKKGYKKLWDKND